MNTIIHNKLKGVQDFADFRKLPITLFHIHLFAINNWTTKTLDVILRQMIKVQSNRLKKKKKRLYILIINVAPCKLTFYYTRLHTMVFVELLPIRLMHTIVPHFHLLVSAIIRWMEWFELFAIMPMVSVDEFWIATISMTGLQYVLDSNDHCQHVSAIDIRAGDIETVDGKIYDIQNASHILTTVAGNPKFEYVGQVCVWFRRESYFDFVISDHRITVFHSMSIHGNRIWLISKRQSSNSIIYRRVGPKKVYSANIKLNYTKFVAITGYVIDIIVLMQKRPFYRKIMS